MTTLARLPPLPLESAPTVPVTVMASPYSSASSVAQVPAGACVLDVLQLVDLSARLPLTVWRNGNRIDPQDFARCRIDDRGTWVFAQRAGLASIGNLLVSVLSSAASGAPSAIPSVGLATAIAVNAALIYGVVSFLRGSTFRPPSDTGGAFSDADRSVRLRNEFVPYSPVPVVVGRLRVTPPYGAVPVTEITGGQRFQRLLFDVGYGELALSEPRIGVNPLLAEGRAISYAGIMTGDGVYEDVEMEFRPGLPTDAPMTLYPATYYEDPLDARLVAGRSVVRRTQPNTAEFQADVVFPKGLFRIANGGRLRNTEARWRVLYREVSTAPDGAWTTAKTLHFTEKKQKPVYASTKVTPATPGEFEVKLARLSANEGSGTPVTAMKWTVLRSIANTPPTTLTNRARISLRIRDSGQLAGLVDTLNVFAETVAAHWNGSSWTTPQATDNPADLMRWAAQSGATRNAAPDSRLDLPQLQAFAERCTAAGFKCNAYVRRRTKLHEVLEQIARTGRASYQRADGLISVAIDDPDDTTARQFFGPRNMVEGTFQGSIAYVVQAHALKVRFRDEARDFAEVEEIVYADGFSKTTATIFEPLELWGVTSLALAKSHARYFMAIALHRRERWTFNLDFEHLPIRRGSIVRFQHDTALIGLASGRVVGFTENGSSELLTLDVDNLAPMEAGKDYVVRLRLKTGVGSLLEVDTVAGDNSTLTLATPEAAHGVEGGELYLFGEEDAETQLCRVRRVQPLADMKATIELERAAPEVHVADGSPIPSFSPLISEPPPVVAGPPPRPGLALRDRERRDRTKDTGTATQPPRTRGSTTRGKIRVGVAARRMTQV